MCRFVLVWHGFYTIQSVNTMTRAACGDLKPQPVWQEHHDKQMVNVYRLKGLAWANINGQMNLSYQYIVLRLLQPLRAAVWSSIDGDSTSNLPSV